ncbi:hypothetical protein HK102_003558 [Quaeritorhiza haematococci]|nr:hypothetical protein HK102_003558 [Quaeritorhiza haematococci]
MCLVCPHIAPHDQERDSCKRKSSVQEDVGDQDGFLPSSKRRRSEDLVDDQRHMFTDTSRCGINDEKNINITKDVNDAASEECDIAINGEVSAMAFNWFLLEYVPQALANRTNTSTGTANPSLLPSTQQDDNLVTPITLATNEPFVDLLHFAFHVLERTGDLFDDNDGANRGSFVNGDRSMMDHGIPRLNRRAINDLFPSSCGSLPYPFLSQAAIRYDDAMREDDGGADVREWCLIDSLMLLFAGRYEEKVVNDISFYVKCLEHEVKIMDHSIANSASSLRVLPSTTASGSAINARPPLQSTSTVVGFSLVKALIHLLGALSDHDDSARCVLRANPIPSLLQILSRGGGSHQVNPAPPQKGEGALAVKADAEKRRMAAEENSAKINASLVLQILIQHQSANVRQMMVETCVKEKVVANLVHYGISPIGEQNKDAVQRIENCLQALFQAFKMDSRLFTQGTSLRLSQPAGPNGRSAFGMMGSEAPSSRNGSGALAVRISQICSASSIFWQSLVENSNTDALKDIYSLVGLCLTSRAFVEDLKNEQTVQNLLLMTASLPFNFQTLQASLRMMITLIQRLRAVESMAVFMAKVNMFCNKATKAAENALGKSKMGAAAAAQPSAVAAMSSIRDIRQLLSILKSYLQ